MSQSTLAAPIDFAQFQKVDIRVGRIVSAEVNASARKPAYTLTIDFGPEIGTRTTSAQLTNYPREQLIGSQVFGVVNLPARRIGEVTSEVLVLAVPDPEAGTVLLRPDRTVALGVRVF